MPNKHMHIKTDLESVILFVNISINTNNEFTKPTSARILHVWKTGSCRKLPHSVSGCAR